MDVMANKLVITALVALAAAGPLVPLAFAQQYSQPTGGPTLEEQLKLARERIEIVREHPGQGSGTPYLDPNGVVGATMISAAVFGGIFLAFVVRARQIEKKLAAARLHQ